MVDLFKELKAVTVTITVAVALDSRPEKWIVDAVQENLEADEFIVRSDSIDQGLIDIKVS